MELIGIAHLQAGYVVAADIYNSSGALLCPKGFIVTDEAVERLKNAGISTVMIESAPEAQVERIDKRIECLEMRFVGIEDPLLLELKQAALSRLEHMRLETR